MKENNNISPSRSYECKRRPCAPKDAAKIQILNVTSLGKLTADGRVPEEDRIADDLLRSLQQRVENTLLNAA